MKMTILHLRPWPHSGPLFPLPRSISISVSTARSSASARANVPASYPAEARRLQFLEARLHRTEARMRWRNVAG